MREIKFRGRDAYGKYRYGDLWQRKDGTLIYDEVWHRVDPETVAQLIGHDTDGAEIYEGDIYFDIDAQTQTHAPCIDELVNEALGDNFVSLDCYEIERAKNTLVEVK